MTRYFYKGPALLVAVVALLFVASPTPSQAQWWWHDYGYYGGGYYDDDFYDDDWYYDYYDYDDYYEGRAILEQNLPPGERLSFYRDELRDLGYLITSVNDQEEDYVEYEVVKGLQTYEIKIELEEETGRATEVDVDSNLWRADSTEQALENVYYDWDDTWLF